MNKTGIFVSIPKYDARSKAGLHPILATCFNLMYVCNSYNFCDDKMRVALRILLFSLAVQAFRYVVFSISNADTHAISSGSSGYRQDFLSIITQAMFCRVTSSQPLGSTYYDTSMSFRLGSKSRWFHEKALLRDQSSEFCTHMIWNWCTYIDLKPSFVVYAKYLILIVSLLCSFMRDPKLAWHS